MSIWSNTILVPLKAEPGGSNPPDPPEEGPFLLLEDGAYILLEDGSRLLLG
jgi:hypothetical protein